jgi:GT2 family glycosyltransferase
MTATPAEVVTVSRTPPAPPEVRAADAAALADLTVVITNHNGRAVLEPTLLALEELGVDGRRIVLVDDGSTDGSPAWVAARWRGVRVFSLGRNTRRLNVVRNRGLRQAATRYVLLLDNDIAVQPGCVAELMRVMRSRPGVLCCTPRLLYHDDAERIYQDGARPHFLGITTGQVRGVPVSDRPGRDPIPTFGGGIMLIDRHCSAEIGDFDEGYAIGWADDAEFQLRGRLAGYEALHVPTATCLHLDRSAGRARAYGQVYNRYRLILTTYAGRTLLVLGPALLAFELCLTAVAAASGFFPDRLRAVRDIWRDRRSWLRHRYDVQRRRRRSDADILVGGAMSPPARYAERSAGGRLMRALSTVFDGYWAVARHLL